MRFQQMSSQEGAKNHQESIPASTSENKQTKYESGEGIMEKIAEITSCFRENKFELAIIPLCIKGIQTNALVDSGAAVSLTGLTLFEKLKPTDLKPKYMSRAVKIQAIGQIMIPFTKTIEFTFGIQNKFVKNLYFVTDRDFSTEYDLLLGYAFLKENKVIQDCAVRNINKQ